jgi:TonB family protein
VTLRRQVPVTPAAPAEAPLAPKAPPRSSRLPLVGGGLVAVAVLIGAAWFLLRPELWVPARSPSEMAALTAAPPPPPVTATPQPASAPIGAAPEPPTPPPALRSAAESPAVQPASERPIAEPPTVFRPPSAEGPHPVFGEPPAALGVAEPPPRPVAAEPPRPPAGRPDADAGRSAAREAAEAEQRRGQAEAELAARRLVQQDLPVGDRISGPPLVYPPIMEREGRGGFVDIECAIDAGGHPRACRVVEQNGPPVFGAAALTYIRGSTYRPARRGGVNVMDPHHRFHVEFRLNR